MYECIWPELLEFVETLFELSGGGSGADGHNSSDMILVKKVSVWTSEIGNH